MEGKALPTITPEKVENKAGSCEPIVSFWQDAIRVAQQAALRQLMDEEKRLTQLKELKFLEERAAQLEAILAVKGSKCSMAIYIESIDTWLRY